MLLNVRYKFGCLFSGTFALRVSLIITKIIEPEERQDAYNFIHYDLHATNILIRILTNPKQITINGYSFYTSYEPVIIDFGMSVITVKTKDNIEIRYDGFSIKPKNIKILLENVVSSDFLQISRNRRVKDSF